MRGWTQPPGGRHAAALSLYCSAALLSCRLLITNWYFPHLHSPLLPLLILRSAAENSSEFSRAARNQPVLSNRPAEEAPPKKPPRFDRRDDKPSRRKDSEDDEDEEEGYANRRDQRGKKSSTRYDEDDYGPRKGPGYEHTSRDDEAPRRRDKDRQRDDDENDEGWKGTKSKNRSRDSADREAGRAEREATAPAPRARQPLDLSDLRRFLTTPLPREAGVVQCYIRRNKSGTNKLFPVYTLYLKDGDRFLLTSKKRPNNKTSNYLISMGENDLNRTSDNFLGKLRSNFMGTEFQIFDDGFNPKEERGAAGGN